MNNTEITEKYKKYLIEDCGVSENTVQSYCRDLRQFCAFCAGKNLILIDAEPETISEYIDLCRSSGKAEASLARTVSSLKSFYSYLSDKHIMTRNPAEQIGSIKVSHVLPQVLTYSEVKKLLELPDLQTGKGIRDRAALELLYATGMKVSEIVNLDISDFNSDAGTVMCRAKSGTRVIPLHSISCTALKRYILTVRNELVHDDLEKALFLNMTGERITRQGFWKIIKHYQDISGISKEITPYMIRHSFGAEMIRNGADVYTVQELMGHKDIVSTRVYCSMISADVKRIYNKAHPRA